MDSLNDDKRLWLGGGALIAVVIALLGWFLVISPEMSAAASTRDEADSARQQNTVLAAKNARLKSDNDNVAALREGLSAAVSELPFDTGLEAFTRQLSAQATANSVLLSSIAVGSAAAVGAGSGGTDAATNTSGLVSIPVTLITKGTFGDQLGFLTALQVDGPRRALVSSVQWAPPQGSGGADQALSATLQLTVFSAPLKPDAQAALEKLLNGK